MDAPKRLAYNGQTYWDRPRAYIVEYIVHQSGPTGPSKIRGVLRDKYSIRMQHANVCALLADLVQQGALAKLARGVYIHSDKTHLLEIFE